jgi:hypothetical protein
MPLGGGYRSGLFRVRCYGRRSREGAMPNHTLGTVGLPVVVRRFLGDGGPYDECTEWLP